VAVAYWPTAATRAAAVSFDLPVYGHFQPGPDACQVRGAKECGVEVHDASVAVGTRPVWPRLTALNQALTHEEREHRSLKEREEIHPLGMLVPEILWHKEAGAPVAIHMAFRGPRNAFRSLFHDGNAVARAARWY